jgi:hypothetical protein
MIVYDLGKKILEGYCKYHTVPLFGIGYKVTIKWVKHI